jgi:heavy metal sensor kinase
VSLPIRLRLTLWYTGLLAVTIAALSAFLVVQLRADLLDALDEEVRIGSVELTKAVADEAADSDFEIDDTVDDDRDFREAAQAILAPASTGAQLLDRRGRTLSHYGRFAGRSPIAPARLRSAAARGDARTYTASLGPDGQRFRVRVSSVQIRGQVRVLVLAETLRPVEDAVRRVLVLLLIAGPAGLVLTGLAGYWLAHKALRPVERITTDARAIGIDQLHERVAVPRSDDETRELAVTLNAMLERIETGVLEKHRLVSDASHGLRTPLAIMRSEVDVALAADELSPAARTVLASTREEVDRMTRTIDNLTTAAQADEGHLELLTRAVDLRAIVDDTVQSLAPLAAAKEQTVLTEGDTWQVQADPARLRLVLTNLVDNAIKFSPPATTVRVATWHRDGEVGVTVTDEGPGVPAAEHEHLFDRYFRGGDPRGQERSGSGLGLAICREVALAHGGRIWVDSTPDGGSAFSLALPEWRSLSG